MYGPRASADTIYGCGNQSRTRLRRCRHSCRPTRSPAPSRVRWATSGTQPVSPSAPRHESSARRRRSFGGWKIRATCHRSVRSRGSRWSTATSWRSTSRRRARWPLRRARAVPAKPAPPARRTWLPRKRLRRASAL